MKMDGESLTGSSSFLMSSPDRRVKREKSTNQVGTMKMYRSHDQTSQKLQGQVLLTWIKLKKDCELQSVSSEDCSEKSVVPLAANQEQLKRVTKLLPLADIQREVLAWLAALRIVQQQHGELLVAIESRLNKQTTCTDTTVVSEPFNDVEDFQQFDGNLSGSAKEALVKELISVGGSSPESCTRRIFRILMSNSLVATFSGNGKKRKKCFEHI
ncbi:uncharacterized protein [Dermacentor albipictus]